MKNRARRSDRDGAETPMTVKYDTHILENPSMAKMARSSSLEAGGIITAGNASAVVDGAAAMNVGREADAKVHDVRPLARIAGMGVAACEPAIKGWGPVPATEKALAAAGIRGADIDHVELNEALPPGYRRHTRLRRNGH